MAYQISWTDHALEDYKIVIDYLLINWPTKVAIEFEAIVNKKIFYLSQHPFIGIESAKKLSVMSILLTKHNRLYYRIRNNMIEILNIFDTRQDPAKNPY